jgi:hypothetical protein
METVKARRGRPARKEPSLLEKAIHAENAPVEVAAASLSDRPSMRPSMREDDPRAAAARRAAEIRGHIGDLDEGTDEFRAPNAPDGWTYQWKRRVNLGQEDPAYQVKLARDGWEPVPTSRHPETMPHDGKNPIIERKGMVLMQMPTSIIEEKRNIELRRARGQVLGKQQQLSQAPDGHFERNSKETKIRNSYEPLQVPNE